MPAPPTVVFDLDGTLTDSRAGITACIRHALDRVGWPCPDEAALAAYVGPPLRGTLSILLGTDDRARADRTVKRMSLTISPRLAPDGAGRFASGTF